MSVNTFSKRTEIDLRSIQLRSILVRIAPCLETTLFSVLIYEYLNFVYSVKTKRGMGDNQCFTTHRISEFILLFRFIHLFTNCKGFDLMLSNQYEAAF